MKWYFALSFFGVSTRRVICHQIKHSLLRYNTDYYHFVNLRYNAFLFFEEQEVLQFQFAFLYQLL
jgi:hypothetical protein